ncbi:MAG: 5-(carboxyamino)imidazole ribonucleotide mutase [Vampirovibrionales bacterium]|nr:5-(carboxyamino)imidazole ribonucleotide mutase [Vampirovibrionales bacterium]
MNHDLTPPLSSPQSQSQNQSAKVLILMGSTSDWPTMQHCVNVLQTFHIAVRAEVVSAHRTPDKLTETAKSAYHEGIEVIIAGAGGAAHLPGMLAAHTHIPVLGVPIQSKILNGIDSLLSIVQMPAGVPVATLAIGEAGAKNAALLAVSILALSDKELLKRLLDYRQIQTQAILETARLV